MPKPVFIIVSRSNSLDRSSGFLSIFEVIEGYALAIGNDPQGIKALEGVAGEASSSIEFKVVATWMRDDSESPSEEFEHQIEIRSPGEPAKLLHSSTLSFEKTFHRIMISTRKIAPWEQSGTVEVEARIKKVGSDDWVKQIYPFPVVVHKAASAD
jgi:hypothetical protein